MFWIIIIIIAILTLLFLSYWYSYHLFNSTKDTLSLNSDIYPTIHARCKQDPKCDGTTCVRDCGGDLICDEICHRCKKKLDGSCSSSVDCKTGLICHNWICVHPDSLDVHTDTEIIHSKPTISKQVHWNNNYEIYNIPPRPNWNRKF